MAKDTVKVDPLALQKCADDILNQYQKCIGILDTMEQKINATSSYWKGSAATKYRSEFKKKKNKCTELLGQMKSYPGEIAREAKIYLKTDKDAASEVEGISSVKGFTME